MGRSNQPETGRRAERHPCPSCQMRFKVGEPRAHDAWPAQLALDEKQVDLLLVAAAEFRDMCEECENCDHDPHGVFCNDDEDCLCRNYVRRGSNDPISFLDWIRPEALSRSFDSPVMVRERREA